MSKLYGYLQGDRGQTATKASNQFIEARVQTQRGRVTVGLNQYGNYTVTEQRSVGGNYASGYTGSREVASGNVDTDEGQSRTRASRRGGGQYRTNGERSDEWLIPTLAAGAGLGLLLLFSRPPRMPEQINVTVIDDCPIPAV